MNPRRQSRNQSAVDGTGMKLRPRVRKPYVYSDSDYDVCKQKKLMMKIKKSVEKKSHANMNERNLEVTSKRATVEENPDEVGNAIIEREGKSSCMLTSNKRKQIKNANNKPRKQVPDARLVSAQKQWGTEETVGLLSKNTRTAAEGSALIQGSSSLVVEDEAAGDTNPTVIQEKSSEYSPVTGTVCTVFTESVETEVFPCINSSGGPELSPHKDIGISLNSSVPVKLFPQLLPTRAYQKRKLIVEEDDFNESANDVGEEDVMDLSSDSSDLEDEEAIKTINKRTVTTANVVSRSKFCSPTMESLLESLGLTSLQHVFSRHKISVAILAQMSDEELRDVGVIPFGDRFKLRTAAKYFVTMSN